MTILLGSIGFILYFMYDINSIKWKKSALHYNFFIGTAIIFGTTIYMLAKSVKGVEEITGTTVIIGTVAILFLILLVYTLFFALPFEETYITDNERLAYTEGVYALCRHPGVLWFIGFYICTGFAMESAELLAFGVVTGIWNVFYVIFQDCYVFPRTFNNYSEYKKSTPFLIPTGKSMKRCISTIWGRINRR